MSSKASQSISNLTRPPKPQIPIVNLSSDEDVTILSLSLIQLSPIIASSSTNVPDVPRLSSPTAKIYVLELYHQKNRNLPGPPGTGTGLQIIWDKDEESDGTVSGASDGNLSCSPQEHSLHVAHEKTKTSTEMLKERENQSQSRLTVSSGTLFCNNTSTSTGTGTGRVDRGKSKSSQEEHNRNSSTRVVPIIMLPSQDPTDANGIPCVVRGYSIPYCNYQEGTAERTSTSTPAHFSNSHSHSFEITNGTLVQILPPIEAEWINQDQQLCAVPLTVNDDNGSLYDLDRCTSKSCDFVYTTSLLSELIGVMSSHQKYSHEDFLLSYQEETVRALTIRMRMLIENQSQVMVGTTEDAVFHWQEGQRRQKRMDQALDVFLSLNVNGSSEKEENRNSTKEEGEVSHNHGLFLQHGALTVHDPIHGSGKTTLVATIARTKLNCHSVHVINASALFAQYGASGADAALESLLHGIVLSAAAVNMNSYSTMGSVCVILDKLETFVPPRMSGGRDTGDPAIPALNAIRAYLTKVVSMIGTMGAFPYPTKNPLYNVKGQNGCVIPVKLLLVGIVTCDDDGGRKSAGNGYNTGTVLDTLGENRYRLPSPSINAGIEIFNKLFEKHDIILSTDAREELPFLVSSMQNMKGSSLQAVLTKLNQCIQAKIKGEQKDMCVNVHDLQMVFMVGRDDNGSLSVSKTNGQRKSDGNESATTLFSSIGGNDEAKKSLLDALAFDRRKRMILSKFGLAPPTGVLLYGPPGCGKTLLAKATAQMMEPSPRDGVSSRGLGEAGGLFISLSASDIARSEVGQSEKLVAKAFETARDNAPSVIFIDEFQALFTSRDGVGGGGKSSGRLASTLLQCMDDISKWRDTDQSVAPLTTNEDFESDRVVVLGATNTPWMVDRAFLRAGRFDRVVHVGLPNERERESILHVHVRRMKLSGNTSVAEICKTIACETLGFSGADIAALVRSAAVRCLNESTSAEVTAVEMRHFKDARMYNLTEPTSNNALVEKLLKWRP